MSVVHKPINWGAQEFIPLNGGSGQVHGLSTAMAWRSDVIDLQEVFHGSVHIVVPAAASTYAQAILSSATSDCGLLITANTPGASATTVVFNAPAGNTSSVATVGSVITVSPSAVATNGSIMALLNKNASASALITVDLYGSQANGDPWSSLQEDPMDACRSDLVVVTGSTALVGGGVAAPTGTLQVYASNLPDVSSFVDLGASFSLTVAGTGGYILNLANFGHRYIYLAWAANGGSLGQLYGAVMGKGAHS